MQSAIQLTAEDRAFAEDFHRRYKAKEGSQHIAGKVALAYLSALLRVHRPRVAIECGAGIGTITDALLSHPCNVERVITTEHNEFCLAALAQNLGHHDPKRLTIVTDRKALASIGLSADLIVGDGGFGRKAIYRAARPGTAILIEGLRSKFRDELLLALNERGLTAQLDQFGTSVMADLLNPVIARLPALVRPRRLKGCWIGQVQALAAEAPATPFPVPAASR